MRDGTDSYLSHHGRSCLRSCDWKVTVRAPRENGRVGHRALFCGLFILFWLVLIKLPTQSFRPELDTSWQGVLSYVVFKGLQFGKDIVFTYGPLGYVTTDTYSGYLLASRIGFDLALKGVFALIMVALALRLRPVLRWWFAVNIVFFSAISPDALYLFAIALSACLVIESQLSLGLALGVGVLFAFVSLTKFTFFLLCATSLVIVVTYAVSKRKWFRAGGLLAVYLICLLLFWCLAGQQISGFLPFLRGAYEVASGYAGAMSIHESRLEFWGGVSALLLGVGLFIGLARNGGEKGRNLAMLMVVCVSSFLAWKEGFVRADYHHICTLFAFLLFAEPAAWAVFQPPDKHQGLLLGLTLVALLSPYVLLSRIHPGFFSELLPRIRARIVENGGALIHPREFRAALEEALSREKEQNALPTIKRLIGQDSVDVFGYEQAVALLNDLNYRPPPVFQGYSAYTPFLVGRNRSYYLGSTAPAVVILKYQTVDDRLAAEDDAGVMEVVLRNYVPVATEKAYMLWKRKAGAALLTSHRLLREGAANWDEPLLLSSNECPAWIEIDIGSTWLGKLHEFFYKPAKFIMTLETTDHEAHRYRLVRSLAKSGFIINPALRDLDDLMEMYKNPGKGNVSSVTLDVEDSAHRLYWPRYHYRIYREGGD